MAKIRRINPRRDRAQFVARSLRTASKSLISEFGDNLAGFAIVSWDMCGNSGAAYSAKEGPVSDALVPDYARTQLICRLIKRGE